MGGRRRKGGGGRRAQAAEWIAAPLFVLGAAGLAPGALAGALSSPGCLDSADPAQVAAIGEEMTIRLADGREIRLAGIDPVRQILPGDTAAATAHAALQAWLAGRTVTVRALSAEPDRWGRLTGLVFAGRTGQDESGAAARVSVAEAMIEAGYARAKPEPAIRFCWAAFLAIEAAARAGGLGLWAEPYYAVLPATDRAALAERMGSMAIVEGRIVRVFQGRARTYLGFDAARPGFAVTVERRYAERMRKDGTDPAAWKDRTVRVRGFLDDRFGPQIEMTALDQLEFIKP